MNMPPILAHGALGPFDEIILLSVAAIFIIFMGISWVKSRNTNPEDFLDPDDFAEDDARTQTEQDDPQRFTLD